MPKSMMTKGNGSTFQILMTKGQRGLDEIRDPDGTVFRRVSPPITDPALLAEHKKGKKAFLTKQMTKMTLGLGGLAVGLAALPYLGGVCTRTYKKVQEFRAAQKDGLLAKKYQEIEEEVENGPKVVSKNRIMGRKIGWTINTGISAAAEILSPRKDEIEEFIDIIQPVGGSTAAFVGFMTALVGYAYYVDDGSKWEVTDKSGKTMPVDL